jgi:hypothetical protein
MRMLIPALIALFFCAAIAASILVWNECRSEGHSFLYCLRLVSR